MTDTDLQHSIDELRQIEERHLRTHQWWYALLHGILAGIGGTVGVAIVLTLMLGVLNQFSSVPGADSARSLLERAVER